MYCRNCGNEVFEKAIMCVSCGTPPLAGNNYCYNCRGETSPLSTICMKCGAGLNPSSENASTTGQVNLNGKDHLTALLLCLFLGYLGVHRFYTKHTAIGIIQLLTFGGCGLWVLIDFIQIVSDNFKDADGNKLVHRN